VEAPGTRSLSSSRTKEERTDPSSRSTTPGRKAYATEDLYDWLLENRRPTGRTQVPSMERSFRIDRIRMVNVSGFSSLGISLKR